ncbi:RusA family crossover junction endodeoxyribonuclease [Pseudomonas sp. HMWF032]|uniref:RusA family crossover junction endodeoxyribonuclease n=1 Tax=Pseudomonas sp. HMWF032 TaxID=2056866 RepID=UPI000D36E9CC|nr:RusA family crossover junction endodeoxyribonuclease [Pseudomonas sp. HMWF032]PTS84009.1 RusA family crossover junction endodeoxyribonuclease [Pseudomonas sp. HMWF032]PTT85364.1 RusA family crossover junction endodeoxyribonuclease [Pseudomonas sp. HMWF010]
MSDLKPVAFVVPGEPVGKGRPKTSARKVGDKVITRHYTPEKTANYEGLIAHAAHQAMAGRSLITGAVMVELFITVSVPQSWSKKRKLQALAGQIFPVKKPDKDNIIKAIYDGLNGVVWVDDVQAVDGRQRKRYGDVPGVQVRVIPLIEGAC